MSLKLSKETIETIKYLYREKSIREISSILSLTYHEVRTTVKLLGITKPRKTKLYLKDLEDVLINEIITEYSAGKTMKELSTKYSIPPPEISKLLRSSGSKIRHSSEGRVLSEESKKKMRDSRFRVFRENPDELERLKNLHKVVPRQSPEITKFKRKMRSVYKRLLRRLDVRSGFVGNSEKLLGYSQKEFNEHIHRLLGDTPDLVQYEIDHIVPVDAFLSRGITDPKYVNALINLRPLAVQANRIKSNKYDMSYFDKDLQAIMDSIK